MTETTEPKTTEPDHCPCCGSGNIVGDSMEDGDSPETMKQRAWCLDCPCEWVHTWGIQSTTVITEPEPETTEPETTEPKFFARHSTIPHDLDPDGYYEFVLDRNPGWAGLYLYPRPVQVKRQGGVYQIQVSSGRRSLVVPVGETPLVDATGAEYPRQKDAHWAQVWAVLTFIDPEN